MARLSNGKLLDVCPNCGKVVRLNKPFIGSTHICTTPEEQSLYRVQINQEVWRSRQLLAQAIDGS